MRMSRVQRLIVNRSNNRKKLELVERTLELVGAERPDRALEIGCGAGFVAEGLMRRYNTSVVGVDIDQEQLRIARERHGHNENLCFLESDAANLPFEDEEFDLVLSQMVLHHISEWEETLREVARVLKTNCFYIFDDAVYTDITGRYLRPLLKGHSFYSKEEVASILGQCDMRLVYQEEPWGLLKFLVRHCVMVFQKRTEE
jgi:ubiquinone/menaquinone biosynthesis C-methylase UbiE